MSDLTKEGDAAWEAIADGWAEMMALKSGPAQSRELLLDDAHLRLLGDLSGKLVLDAGCGEGRFARKMRDLGAEVTAFDLSERMIANAQKHEADSPLGIDYHLADMTDLSRWPGASFDVVLSYLSIIDVEDYTAAINEIGRVLKPGGQFLFSIVHPCFAPPGATWEPRTSGTIPIWDKDKLYKKIDGYFPARELRFKMWPTAPAMTVNYHRPITEYATTLRDAGFLMRDIDEPVPTEEVLKHRDDLREFLRAPYFIIFQCVKA